VNRPEFRELAPFLYYDFINEANITGNTNLQTARIHNVDLRYEFYPRPGETISLAGFYKNFNRPIENIVAQASDGTQLFSFKNADVANNVGVELEVRKSLSDIAATSFLKNLSLVFNGSWIYSRVDLGEDPTLIQDRVRALQGQSPYIVNLAAFYDDRDRGFAVNVFYNVFGKRIFRVGSDIFPTVYEMPRNMLDVTLSKNVGERLTFKVGGQNILNAPFRFLQDSDRNREIGGLDQPITTFRRGAYYTAGVTFRL
jgi:outer membrane receptor protein involved in Fe transport